MVIRIAGSSNIGNFVLTTTPTPTPTPEPKLNPNPNPNPIGSENPIFLSENQI